MRIGAGAGPFYASTSTKGCGPWVVAFFVLFIIIALAITYPWEAGGVGVLLVVGVTALVRRSRRGSHPFSAEQAAEAFAVMRQASEMYGRGELALADYQRIQGHSLAIIRRGPPGWEPSHPPPTVTS